MVDSAYRDVKLETAGDTKPQTCNVTELTMDFGFGETKHWLLTLFAEGKPELKWTSHWRERQNPESIPLSTSIVCHLLYHYTQLHSWFASGGGC